MITTCPACHTAFRITREQLDARQGRVRCGLCKEIFDARISLRNFAGDEAQTASGGSATKPEVSAYERPQTAPDSHQVPAPALAPWEGENKHEVPAPALAPAERKNKLGRRRPWLLGSCLLMAILILQVAFGLRGDIATLYPEAKPYLQEICDTFECELPLPRRTELISIESSDLQADTVNPKVMVLTATIRNRAAFPQAYPALELTLTDSEDKALARRVLSARDYLTGSVNPESSFRSNSEFSVRVPIEATALKATGYRLYLFFP